MIFIEREWLVTLQSSHRSLMWFLRDRALPQGLPPGLSYGERIKALPHGGAGGGGVQLDHAHLGEHTLCPTSFLLNAAMGGRALNRNIQITIRSTSSC